MSSEAERLASRRRVLVDELRRQGIDDEVVLAAIAEVPRHLFVPDTYARSAYANHPLPVSEGQTISQPWVVAAMSAALQLSGGERVLEIGTGSGYQAAVLHALGARVWSMEVRPELARIGRRNLDRAGCQAVQTQVADGYDGWPEEAPFERIILTAAPDELPPALLQQLAPDGRLVAPVGPIQQRLLVVHKTPSGLRTQDICGVLFVPMLRADELR